MEKMVSNKSAHGVAGADRIEVEEGEIERSLRRGAMEPDWGVGVAVHHLCVGSLRRPTGYGGGAQVGDAPPGTAPVHRVPSPPPSPTTRRRSSYGSGTRSTPAVKDVDITTIHPPCTVLISPAASNHNPTHKWSHQPPDKKHQIFKTTFASGSNVAP